MGYFGPYFMILVQPTSKVVFNALKSVTIPALISYILLSDNVPESKKRKLKICLSGEGDFRRSIGRLLVFIIIFLFGSTTISPSLSCEGM